MSDFEVVVFLDYLLYLNMKAQARNLHASYLAYSYCSRSLVGMEESIKAEVTEATVGIHEI